MAFERIVSFANHRVGRKMQREPTEAKAPSRPKRLRRRRSTDPAHGESRFRNTAETWERGCEHATIRRRAESSGDISRHADKQHPVWTARPPRAERTAPGRWRRRHLIDLSFGPIRHHLAVRTAALEPASR